MNRTKLQVMGVLAVGLAAVLSGCESADQAAARDEPAWYWGVAPEETEVSPTGLAGTQVGANLHRASELTGTPLRTFDGEALGTVYDLVLTPDLNGVSYAAVSDGRGFHAIPWSAIQTGPDGRLVAALSEQELAQKAGFREWPAEGDPHWLDRPEEQAERAESGAMTAAERLSIQRRRFSLIEGMPARGREGDRVGTVQDLVVATDTGAVAYTVVSFGGFLGLGREYAAVPMTAVDLDTQQQVARVDANRRTLEAYAFSPGEFPNLSDPLYAQELARAYGLEYDTVLGYVPAEE